MVQSLFKTGVVAHIVGMPANTMRVWERRYGLKCSQIDDHGHLLRPVDDLGLERGVGDVDGSHERNVTGTA